MAELVRAGKVRYLDSRSLTRNRAPRAQGASGSCRTNGYSLFSREPEEGLLERCGTWHHTCGLQSHWGWFPRRRFRSIDDLAPGDWRRGNPRVPG